MSYYTTLFYQEFSMTAENVEKANAVMAKVTDEGILDAAKHWASPIEDDGSVREIEFNGNRYKEDIHFFKLIAPFVNAGSYIEMQGEEGEIWRYAFDGTDVVEEQVRGY